MKRRFALPFLLLFVFSACGRIMEKEVGKGCIEDVEEEVAGNREWSPEKRDYVTRQLQIEYRLANLANQANLRELRLPTYKDRSEALAREFDLLRDVPASKTADQPLLGDLSASNPANKNPEKKGDI